MGVRLYDPALSRFLQVDPIEGGSANDYDYVGAEPCGRIDLTGTNWVTNKVDSVWKNARCAKAYAAFPRFAQNIRKELDRRRVVRTSQQMVQLLAPSGYWQDIIPSKRSLNSSFPV